MSQFTLLANTSKGSKPDFHRVGSPISRSRLSFWECLREDISQALFKAVESLLLDSRVSYLASEILAQSFNPLEQSLRLQGLSPSGDPNAETLRRLGVTKLEIFTNCLSAKSNRATRQIE